MSKNQKRDTKPTTKMGARHKVVAKAVQINRNEVLTEEVRLHSFIPDIEIADIDVSASWTDVLLENIDKGMTPEVHVLSNFKGKQIKEFIENIKNVNFTNEDSSDNGTVEKLEVEILE